MTYCRASATSFVADYLVSRHSANTRELAEDLGTATENLVVFGASPFLQGRSIGVY